ncbi:MAG: diguanylate cyclase, partial [Bradyrhizobium sp.]
MSLRRGPVLWLILSGVLLVAAITIGTGVIISQFRERALSNGERELENTVRLLSRHFDQQLGDLEVPLNDLIAQIHAAGVASPEAFKRYMSAPEMHLLMKAKVSAPSEIAGINAYDSEGTLINSSVVSVVPPVNIADRAYFLALKSDPEPQ